VFGRGLWPQQLGARNVYEALSRLHEEKGVTALDDITLAEQIAEVKRELLMRRRVYIGMIHRRQITAEEAAERSERMAAVQRTLERLRDRELAAAKRMP